MWGGNVGTLVQLATNPPRELRGLLGTIAELIEGAAAVAPEPLRAELGARVLTAADAVGISPALLAAVVRVQGHGLSVWWTDARLDRAAAALASLCGAFGVVDGVRAYCRADDRPEGKEDARCVLLDYLGAQLAAVDRAQLAALGLGS